MLVLNGVNIGVVLASIFIALTVSNKAVSLIADCVLLLVLIVSLAMYFRLREASGGR
jgi:hypothetical protein